MEKLRKIKETVTYPFDIYNTGSGCIILFYVPYLPYNNNPGCARIDSFYAASDTAYKSAVKFADKLRLDGFKCEANPKCNYKEISAKCGNARGKNTLIYKDGMGSRFAIGAIMIYGENLPAENARGVEMPCKNCSLCEKACPVSAISGGFDRKKCMREYMLKPEKAEGQVLKAFSDRVLGCDVCQRVCPLNQKEYGDMPEELAKMLDYKSLLKSIEENNLKGFADVFGSNYSNKNPLLAMLLIAIGNTKKTEFKNIVKKYENSASERVKFAAAYALKELESK